MPPGLGSRLLPHTELRPKCLLKIGGHTILEYQIAALRQCGISEIAIVLGYQGEKIRAHLNTPVTYFENTEYASTGSSYSLWLTRDFIRDGFVYVNSDLIFHPRMLQQLLDAPDPDAIIIDRRLDLTGDMQKAEMDGTRILRMSKSMPAEMAAAEVVGPAKFSADGARELIASLNDRIASGERTRWAYEAFAELATRRPFVGVDNPGCFWAEVDTPADLIEASQRIPSHFIEFRAPRLTTLDQPDERRVWDINRQPIPYMDRLLNSNLAPSVQQLPGCRGSHPFGAAPESRDVHREAPCARYPAPVAGCDPSRAGGAHPGDRVAAGAHVRSGESLERRGSRRGACRMCSALCPPRGRRRVRHHRVVCREAAGGAAATSADGCPRTLVAREPAARGGCAGCDRDVPDHGGRRVAGALQATARRRHGRRLRTAAHPVLRGGHAQVQAGLHQLETSSQAVAHQP